MLAPELVCFQAQWKVPDLTLKGQNGLFEGHEGQSALLWPSSVCSPLHR